MTLFSRSVFWIPCLSFGLWLTACGTQNADRPPTDWGVLETTATNGLNAEYFSTVGFTGPSIKRLVPSINFDFGATAPIPGINANIFSIRFSGELSAPSTGTYTFYLTASDGDRLNIDNKIVLEDYTDHEVRQKMGTIALIAGQPVPLNLEYYKNTGTGSVKLEWSGPGVPRGVIPTARFGTQMPAPAAQTFYVAPNGKDSNPGSETQPWATIQKATRTLTAGQTVLIKNGTYRAGIYIDTSGTPGKPITYKAFPGAQPVFVDSTPFIEGLIIQGASYIRIEGLSLEYTAPGAQAANGERYENGIGIVSFIQGSTVRLPHHIGIFHNRVHGFPGGGIFSFLADYVTMEGNTVWENARWSFYDNSGLSSGGSVAFDQAAGFHNIIRANTVFKNENLVPDKYTHRISDGNCIIIDDNRQTQHKRADTLQFPVYKPTTLVENNICSGNGGRGVHVYSSDNVLVRHNTLYRNQDSASPHISGELTAGDASNVRFVNNIVSTFAGKPATVTDNASNIVFERNLYFGTTNIPNKSSSDLIGDPLFEAPSSNLNAYDFRLKSGSPAIDAALASAAPQTDVGGKPRPQGRAADIGAWESR
jgi:parallel beta-helix repeat protein